MEHHLWENKMGFLLAEPRVLVILPPTSQLYIVWILVTVLKVQFVRYGLNDIKQNVNNIYNLLQYLFIY